MKENNKNKTNAQGKKKIQIMRFIGKRNNEIMKSALHKKLVDFMLSFANHAEFYS